MNLIQPSTGFSLAPVARTIAAGTSGVVATLSPLIAGGSFTRISGSPTIASTGAISIASTMSAGSSVAIVVREALGSLAVEYPVTLTAAYVLASLTVATNGAVGVPISIIGTVAGSVLSSANLPAGATLNSGARTVTFTTAGSKPGYDITETLAGAVGSPRTTTVGPTTIASFIPGAVAPSPAIPFTAQWHVHTAVITMRPDTEFYGYVVARSDGGGGNLVVTSKDPATGFAIREGDVFTLGAAAGSKIRKARYFGGDGLPGGGIGGPGTYETTIAEDVGSAGSPVLFRLKSRQILSMKDTTTNTTYTWTAPDGNGPLLETDDWGVKYLLFADNVDAGVWLANGLMTGIDSHNLGIFAVGAPDIDRPGTLISLGLKSASSGDQNVGRLIESYDNLPVMFGNQVNKMGTNGSAANKALMFVGQQCQVMASVTATDGPINATNDSLSNVKAMRYVNDVGWETIPPSARANNVTGLTLGGDAFYGTADLRGRGYYRCYWLGAYTQKELGNRSTVQPRTEATIATLLANFDLARSTDSEVLASDSRFVFGVGSGGDAWTDASGINIATLLCRRGPNGIPKTLRLINMAVGGQGIGAVQSFLDRDNAGEYTAPSPTADGWRMGSGHDNLTLMTGINDYGNLWPDDSNGGRAASNSTALGNDLYKSGGYTATLLMSTSTYANAATYTSKTGVLGAGSRLVGPGVNAGLSIKAASPGQITGSGFPLSTLQYASLAGVSVTATLLDYVDTCKAILAKGIKLAVTPDTAPLGAACIRLRQRILADLLTDLDALPGGAYAGKVRVFDLQAIRVGTRYPFGADYTGTPLAVNNEYADFPHWLAAGKRLINSGGDTPENGLMSNILALAA